MNLRRRSWSPTESRHLFPEREAQQRSQTAGHILRGRVGAVCWSTGFGPSSHKPLKCFGKYQVCSVVLARVENHPHLVETVLLSLQELDNRPERNGCGQDDYRVPG